MKRKTTYYIIALLFVIAMIGAACANQGPATDEPSPSTGDTNLDSLAEARGLSEDDIRAALMTYTPTGELDDYVMFASGGHGGQVLVIGMPSMRLLRVIGVFTPEPWQGWGYGAGEDVMAGGNIDGEEILWADTHHPALSETEGEYDGEWLFINDKANGRVAVIDLRDFETKQIINNPLFLNDHGGAMVTPNTEYVIEGGQYGLPLDGSYSPLESYESDYRGMVTFWKFDREAGRLDPSQSFALELPPYWQDLCDAGKLVSDGWVFCNSFNTELATGGVEDGNPAFEAGVSEGTDDYMHIINLDAAAEVFAAGDFVDINGMNVITLDTAIENDLLFFTPEPRSPHGVDVAPGGDYLVVSGKLDPHVTIYSFEKIQAAIEEGPTETDQYGVPVLDFDKVVEAQVEVGLGPLHTQFDDQGYCLHQSVPGYSSCTLESWAEKAIAQQDGWDTTRYSCQYTIISVILLPPKVIPFRPMETTS